MQLIVKTRERMMSMKPEKFCEMFNSFKFWPDQVITVRLYRQ